MKTEFKKLPPPEQFTPVALTITFESKRELDAFGALFNACAISDALNHVAGKDYQLWSVLSQAGADIGRYHDEIMERIREHCSVADKFDFQYC